MKFASLLILIAVVSVSQVSGAEWEYPAGGPTGSGEASVGKAGQLHSYNTLTKDRPEKVILWYAKQMGLGEDHGLVEKANTGFDKLDRINTGDYIVVRDTDKEKSGALIIATLSADHAHVHIFIRPENDSNNDMTISITKTPMGTAISVIQSVPTKANKNVAKTK